jgi:foldase protein PrsA
MLLALGAVLAVAVVAVGCGGGVPGNAVAQVEEAGTVTKSQFDHWLRVAAKGSQPQGTGGQPQLPDPPDFKRCIANQRKTLPKPPKGQKAPTNAQLRTQCRQQYNGMRDQVLSFLITAKWIEGEAKDQGLKVTDTEVRKDLETEKKQSFPKEKDFENFLKQSGMTMEDLLFRVRQNTLATKLRTGWTKGKDKVTDTQVTSYYNSHRKQFAQAERRDLLVVLTKTRAKADQARSALTSGQSFKAVAKRYSIDQASKSQGGKLVGVSKGQSEKAFDKAVFAARKGRLVGPVKTQFGYYIFKVTKVSRASQQTLLQAKPTIRNLLSSQQQQKALNDSIQDFRKRWRSRTDCRKGFVIQDCKNAPKPKKSATTPAGGTQTQQ